MSVAVSIRTDEQTKGAADQLFAELGLNMSVAVNMFLRQAVREGRIPFEVTTRQPNAETVAAIVEGKQLLADPSVTGYRSIEALRAALNA